MKTKQNTLSSKHRLARDGKKLMIAIWILLSLHGFAQQKQISIDGWNAYVFTPKEYAARPEKQYPLLLFFPGLDEAGTDAARLLTFGPSKMIADGLWKGNATVKGITTDFIVVSLQYPSSDYLPSETDIQSKLNKIISTYRVDRSRIILTGISGGGIAINNYITANKSFSGVPLGILAFSAGTPRYPVSNMANFALAGGKWWGITGINDQRNNADVARAINSSVAGSARETYFAQNGGGHCCWNDFFNPTFRELIDGESMNIYEWAASLAPRIPVLAYRRPVRIKVASSHGQVYVPNVTAAYHPQPGDTLVIPTGISSFFMEHFSGAPGKPIVVVPADSGIIGGYSSYAGSISFARYFKISGFHIRGTNGTSNPSNFGLVIGAGSDHFEAHHIDIYDVGIGFCTKTNPDKSGDFYYPLYSIDSVYVHHIRCRKTGTEGFYLGYTNDVTSPLAAPLLHLRLHNLVTDSTGWDGVQLSDCQAVSIHDIFVDHFGLLNQSGQQNGMLFGGEVTLKDSASNINVSNGTGAGLLILGRGLFKVTDVVLTNTALSEGQSAIYVSDVADIGYGLPPLRLDLRRIKVNGAASYALNNANNNGTTLPGQIRDFTYKNCRLGVYDLVNKFDVTEKPVKDVKRPKK